MLQNEYQKKILTALRADQRTYGMKFISLSTGGGYSALDAYRKQTWVETVTWFSGAFAWIPYSMKRDVEAGFYKTSDIVIIASRDHRTTAQGKDVRIEYENIKFRVSRVIDCEDTAEIVIYATRLE